VIGLYLLIGCGGGPDPGAGELSGGHFVLPGLELELPLPSGGRWTASADDFVAGLPDTVLEGHAQGVNLALTAHLPPPALGLRLAESSALDRLLELAPPAAEPTPVQRLPDCHGAIEQQLPGMLRVAWASGEGLAVLYAWGPADRVAVARHLACTELK